MLSLLSATTPSGRLYSIDARLRPNGRAGLLVSGVDAFDRYQMEEAWVWELQALTRARPVAGNREIAEKFVAIRQQVLTASRDKTLIKEEILAMRERLRKEHGDTVSKTDCKGCVVGMEFVVQLGLLLNADRFPELIASTEFTEQLRALLVCGWLDDGRFKTLDDAYTQLSQAQQRSTLVDDSLELDNTVLLDTARALCEEILR